MDPQLAARFDQTNERIERLGGELKAELQDVRARLDAERFDRMMAGIAHQFETMQKRSDERFQEVIAEMRRGFEAADRRLDHAMSTVAQQFETMQRRMDGRFDQLAEALDIRFGSLERRVRRLEGKG